MTKYFSCFLLLCLLWLFSEYFSDTEPADNCDGRNQRPEYNSILTASQSTVMFLGTIHKDKVFGVFFVCVFFFIIIIFSFFKEIGTSVRQIIKC